MAKTAREATTGLNAENGARNRGRIGTAWHRLSLPLPRLANANRLHRPTTAPSLLAHAGTSQASGPARLAHLIQCMHHDVSPAPDRCFDLIDSDSSCRAVPRCTISAAPHSSSSLSSPETLRQHSRLSLPVQPSSRWHPSPCNIMPSLHMEQFTYGCSNAAPALPSCPENSPYQPHCRLAQPHPLHSTHRVATQPSSQRSTCPDPLSLTTDQRSRKALSLQIISSNMNDVLHTLSGPSPLTPSRGAMIGRSKTTVRRKPPPPLTPDLLQELAGKKEASSSSQQPASQSSRLKHASTLDDIRAHAAQSEHRARPAPFTPNHDLSPSQQYYLDYDEAKEDKSFSLLEILGQEAAMETPRNHKKIQLPWKSNHEEEVKPTSSTNDSNRLSPTFSSIRKMARQATIRIRRTSPSSNSEHDSTSSSHTSGKPVTTTSPSSSTPSSSPNSSPNSSPRSLMRKMSLSRSDRNRASASPLSNSRTASLSPSYPGELVKREVASLSPVDQQQSTARSLPRMSSLLTTRTAVLPQAATDHERSVPASLEPPRPLRPARSIRRPALIPDNQPNSGPRASSNRDRSKRQAIYLDGKAVVDAERLLVVPTVRVHGEIESLLPAPTSIIDVQHKTPAGVSLLRHSVWSASSDGVSDAEDYENCFSSPESARSSVSSFGP